MTRVITEKRCGYSIKDGCCCPNLKLVTRKRVGFLLALVIVTTGSSSISLVLRPCAPHTHGNPFIRLRLGQCLYQLGERASARTYLLQAHRLGGQDLFADAADQIYLDAIADLI